jgi:hypothetical protein
LDECLSVSFYFTLSDRPLPSYSFAAVMIHWARREHRHGLIESDASDFHKKVYGVTGLAGIRTVPVMLLDDDLAGQPGDEVMVAAAGPTCTT